METWQKYFDHPDASTLGLMNSAGFLPGIISGFFGDWMQRYVGKRWTIWINTMITVAGILVITLSTSVGMFCAGRVIQGFGTSASLAVAPAQLQEISHPRYRASAGALFSCMYYIAAIMSASACLGALGLSDAESWRIPCWVQLFGPAMVILLTFTMPESPRVGPLEASSIDIGVRVLTNIDLTSGSSRLTEARRRSTSSSNTMPMARLTTNWQTMSLGKSAPS